MNEGFVQLFIRSAIALNWIVLCGISLIAAVASVGVIYWARRGGLMDLPNERSSHTVPTPRGGGLAIVAAFVLGLGWLALAVDLDAGLLHALLGGSLLLVTVGFIDDYYSLARRWRLLGQFSAAAWALYCLQGIELIPNLTLLLWVGEQLVLLIGLVWLINLYNFMDGIDGLAASEAIFVSIAIILLTTTAHDISQVLALLVAASAGFLIFNWAPARIFMGDSGSCSLGYVLGVCVLAAAEQQLLSIWEGLILLAVFITDATYTLLRRMASRARWYEPHRSHAYQHAARRFGNHASVTLAVLALNMGWLLPCAWLVSKMPQWGEFVAMLAVLPLLILVYRFGAGSDT